MYRRHLFILHSFALRDFKIYRFNTFIPLLTHFLPLIVLLFVLSLLLPPLFFLDSSDSWPLFLCKWKVLDTKQKKKFKPCLNECITCNLCCRTRLLKMMENQSKQTLKPSQHRMWSQNAFVFWRSSVQNEGNETE